jgi:hypothetical protein
MGGSRRQVEQWSTVEEVEVKVEKERGQIKEGEGDGEKARRN